LPKARKNFATSTNQSFYAATELAELKNKNRSDPAKAVSIYGMHEDILNHARIAFGDRSGDYELNAIKANSAYWYDFSLISKYANAPRGSKCESAWLIFNDLSKLKEKDERAFQVQSLPANDMEEALKILNKRCKMSGAFNRLRK
jgi:hypothetical protein